MQRRVHGHFSLEKLSENRIYTMTNASRFDYQWWMDKNCWRSVDAHFHEGAWSMSLSFFPIEAANTLNIYRNDHIAFDLHYLQDQKSLTLHWRSISERGMECEARSLPMKPAITTSMNGLSCLPSRLPMMQDHRSLTLLWRSFCHWGIHNMLSFVLA